jgi:hypothetical protein
MLANAHEKKARKGHKTDHKDAWWLAHLVPWNCSIIYCIDVWLYLLRAPGPAVRP